MAILDQKPEQSLINLLNNKLWKSGVGWVALVAALIILGSGFYYATRPKAGVFLSDLPVKIHYAGNEEASLFSIRIKAFYFIPRDINKPLDADWKNILQEALLNLKKFYEFELRQGISITYDIYPAPITGDKEHRDYDGRDTSRGNPNALVAIHNELIRRAIRSDGDLYLKDFSASDLKDYEVMAILYEGAGASAMLSGQGPANEYGPDVVVIQKEELPAFLVSKFFLVSPTYEDYGLSIFAHEFGHTLGLTDSYNLETGQPLSDDIMGAGRFRPISGTYLSDETKSKLGLKY